MKPPPPVRRAMPFAVSGRSCIRPIAPALERAFGSNWLSGVDDRREREPGRGRVLARVAADDRARSRAGSACAGTSPAPRRATQAASAAQRRASAEARSRRRTRHEERLTGRDVGRSHHPGDPGVELLQRPGVDVGEVGPLRLLAVGDQPRLAVVACGLRARASRSFVGRRDRRRPCRSASPRRPRRGAAPPSRRRSGGSVRAPRAARATSCTRATTSGCSSFSRKSSASRSLEHAYGDPLAVRARRRRRGSSSPNRSTSARFTSGSVAQEMVDDLVARHGRRAVTAKARERRRLAGADPAGDRDRERAQGPRRGSSRTRPARRRPRAAGSSDISASAASSSASASTSASASGDQLGLGDSTSTSTTCRPQPRASATSASASASASTSTVDAAAALGLDLGDVGRPRSAADAGRERLLGEPAGCGVCAPTRRAVGARQRLRRPPRPASARARAGGARRRPRGSRR